MLKLKTKLSLLYSLFICVALGVLALVINQNTHKIFSLMVTKNIEQRSREIAASISNCYDILDGTFNIAKVEAAGMYFTHSGFIITLTDNDENIVWDARTCDMAECNMVINEIAARMQNDHNINGGMHVENLPVSSFGNIVGTVAIESYGPYFYNESDELFLMSLNRTLFICAIVMLVVCVALSFLLSGAISKPIRDCVKSASLIAGGNFQTKLSTTSTTAELHDLSASLNKMSAALLASKQQQLMFMQDVSHELRTPLTCLSGNIEAIRDKVWEPSAEHFDSCMEEVEHLTKLVEDLTTLTNIEWQSIPLNKTEIDLASLIHVVDENFQNAAAKKGILIECTCAENIFFNADYDRIKQVLFNIVSNAIKYSEEGKIRIDGKKMNLAQSNSGVLITVSDNGEGIAENDLPHIFERFYRCDKSRSRTSGGQGLGLAIAGAIVKAHNGHIKAENAQGGGTIFTVELPVHAY
ncbi:MAG: HAMP domain-containing sensor histidine kinase [Termitinemataceae bacterium]|nr:MAG: HAMP domain-containing sensor histidine kinase [Termitinemataceae bacterium]